MGKWRCCATSTAINEGQAGHSRPGARTSATNKHRHLCRNTLRATSRGAPAGALHYITFGISVELYHSVARHKLSYRGFALFLSVSPGKYPSTGHNRSPHVRPHSLTTISPREVQTTSLNNLTISSAGTEQRGTRFHCPLAVRRPDIFSKCRGPPTCIRIH
jgi:hypothetical protein